MTNRIPFIDWMKATGMLLIVLGHTGADKWFRPTDPINFKQLGVACFVFVTGYTLVKETRPVWRVLYNRLFEVYLFGILIALVISAITYLTSGNLCESNYTPFLFGSNILFNNFPANPTTWYIGTYFHLLLLWAVLFRRVRVRIWMLGASIVLAIVVRASFLSCGNDYVAYQLFTNWVTVLLMGMWAADNTKTVDASWRAIVPFVILSMWTAVWMCSTARLGFRSGNPFLYVPGQQGLQYWLPVSGSISLLYITHTWLFFEISRRMPDARLVRFFARNTLVIFIVHFPLVVWASPYIYMFVPPGVGRVVVNVALYFVALGVFSEALRRTLCTRTLSARIWTFFGLA